MRRIKTFALSVAASALLTSPAFTQEAPVGSIVWQVEDRFRFFSNGKLFQPHLGAANVFAGIDAPRDEFGRKKIKSEWVGPVQFAERRLSAAAIRDSHDGWAAQAYTGSKEPFTCWSTGLRRVRESCVSANGNKGSRLFPAEVSIAVSLDGAATAIFAGKECEWFVHTGKDETWRGVLTADCVKPVRLDVPVNEQFSLLSRVLDPASPQGVLTQVSSVYQQVSSKLIVGFGDSYGAGEGNPDYPANYSKLGTLADTARPEPGTSPRWLDPACHRSVYSHQQRIAMQMAAENTKSVISYLGYACSGASITHVMNGIDSASEHMQPVNKALLAQSKVSKGVSTVLAQSSWSQIDHAVRDLCQDDGAAKAESPLQSCQQWRAKPDLVLLSVGGNDIGFSNVLKWTVAGSAIGSVRFLTGAEKPQVMLDRAQGKQDLAGCSGSDAGLQCSLTDRYVSLATAFENRLGMTDRSKVLIAPYPSAMTNEAGAVCTADVVNKGADSEHFVSTSDDRLQSLQSILFSDKALTNAMKAAVAKTGWTWVDALAWSGAFRRHGVCAGGKRKADTFEMPKLVVGEWQPVSPQDMMAYAQRQRWFRTFNDSVLMQYYVTKVSQLARNPRQPIDYHYQAGISGYFHPTAEGQAVMADMLLNAARCKLFAKDGAC